MQSLLIYESGKELSLVKTKGFKERKLICDIIPFPAMNNKKIIVVEKGQIILKINLNISNVIETWESNENDYSIEFVDFIVKNIKL